ncbi:uncharacterized protein LOC143289990 [Babylonia areolata]|uniref:uncharacterized protein LOC143289990 n=1 Tax=Babylonia areolata TaxID=304850 RepID=UPI003FD09AE8
MSSTRATSAAAAAAGNGVPSRSGSATSSCREDSGGWGVFGGFMAAKKQKLYDQFNSKEGCKSHIFEGVNIYINGYTKPSSDKLRELIMEHGGRYEQYLMKTVVTHIVATSLPNSKIHSLRDFKVVRPEWITDSIKEGRLLSHAPYKLFTRQTNSLAAFSTVLTRSTSSSKDPGKAATPDGESEDSGSEDTGACPQGPEDGNRVKDMTGNVGSDEEEKATENYDVNDVSSGDEEASSFKAVDESCDERTSESPSLSKDSASLPSRSTALKAQHR